MPGSLAQAPLHVGKAPDPVVGPAALSHPVEDAAREPHATAHPLQLLERRGAVGTPGRNKKTQRRIHMIGKQVYRSWFLGHFASGNHAAAPVLGKSAWRTAAGVRWPWRSTSQAWL